MKIGIISGYFDGFHCGHAEYINAAKQQCDFLIAIVNNDKQVELKGSQKFMTENDRKYIIDNLKSVDMSIISIDQDSSVAQTIKYIKYICMFFIPQAIEFTFFNSGDRNLKNTNSKEELICQELNIKTQFIDLPKIYSSTKLKYKLL